MGGQTAVQGSKMVEMVVPVEVKVVEEDLVDCMVSSTYTSRVRPTY